MPDTEAGRALDTPDRHLASCWVNSPKRTDQACDCGWSTSLAAVEAEAAAAEQERLERALRLRLAAEPTPTRQIGLRDAVAILAEPSVIEIEHPGPKVLRGKRFDSVLTDD